MRVIEYDRATSNYINLRAREDEVERGTVELARITFSEYRL